MVQHWPVYGLQLLFGCCVAAILVLFRWAVQKNKPPKIEPQGVTSNPISESFRFHYHLGFVLSFAFLILSIMILPFVLALGKVGADPGLKSRAFFSLMMACFFLLLGISYGVKKGDFKWKRPD